MKRVRGWKQNYNEFSAADRMRKALTEASPPVCQRVREEIEAVFLEDWPLALAVRFDNTIVPLSDDIICFCPEEGNENMLWLRRNASEVARIFTTHLRVLWQSYTDDDDSDEPPAYPEAAEAFCVAAPWFLERATAKMAGRRKGKTTDEEYKAWWHDKIGALRISVYDVSQVAALWRERNATTAAGRVHKLHHVPTHLLPIAGRRLVDLRTLETRPRVLADCATFELPWSLPDDMADKLRHVDWDAVLKKDAGYEEYLDLFLPRDCTVRWFMRHFCCNNAASERIVNAIHGTALSGDNTSKCSLVLVWGPSNGGKSRHHDMLQLTFTDHLAVKMDEGIAFMSDGRRQGLTNVDPGKAMSHCCIVLVGKRLWLNEDVAPHSAVDKGLILKKSSAGATYLISDGPRSKHNSTVPLNGLPIGYLNPDRIDEEGLMEDSAMHARIAVFPAMAQFLSPEAIRTRKAQGLSFDGVHVVEVTDDARRRLSAFTMGDIGDRNAHIQAHFAELNEAFIYCCLGARLYAEATKRNNRWFMDGLVSSMDTVKSFKERTSGAGTGASRPYVLDLKPRPFPATHQRADTPHVEEMDVEEMDVDDTPPPHAEEATDATMSVEEFVHRHVRVHPALLAAPYGSSARDVVRDSPSAQQQALHADAIFSVFRRKVPSSSCPAKAFADRLYRMFAADAKARGFQQPRDWIGFRQRIQGKQLRMCLLQLSDV